MLVFRFFIKNQADFLTGRNNGYRTKMLLKKKRESKSFFSFFLSLFFNSYLPDSPTLNWKKAQHLKIVGF